VSDGLADPFGTAGLRARVLDAWAASPSRFREDANAEEDYALGGYRDRVVVELAQNAADAAVRGGGPGRLRLTLRDGVLTALNTGAPLDAAGVEALSTLRASSKRGDGAGGGTVGRFGVGFAAVAAVSDCPRIRSATGAVGWSRSRTRELAAGIPALAGEIQARSGHVPVLRLPFADPDAFEPADGLVTAVELPLRDDGAVELVARLLAETGPALLLALPALTHVEITVGGATRLLTAVHDGERSTVTVNGVPSVWQVAGAAGELDPALLADRPAEERARTSWSVRWAVPVTGGGAPTGRLPEGVAALGVTATVHAPTPTDEPLSLPALLLASFPLSPDRRHVAPGPLTDFLIERAADGYASLLPELAPGPGLLDLVPGPVGQGELDARLARAIVSRLPGLAFLPPVLADPSGDLVTGRVRPRDAVLLGTSAPGLDEWLAPVLPNLVAGPVRHPAWAVLGVRRLPLAELADLLAALDREPGWWHGLYSALGDVPAEERAELGALPVPLADGRRVRGARGLLLPGPGLEHAGRLAVLGLLAALDIAPGEYPWLAELALPGEDGDWYPAGELLLPGAPLAGVIAHDAPFGTVTRDLVERHGADALRAAGVLSSFGLLTAEDVELDESRIDLDLDGADEWAADTRDRLRLDADAQPSLPSLPSLPPVALEVAAVRDLDLVDPGRWPQALDLLTRPPLRAALTEPTRVRLPDGRHADVPSYTAWWLRRHATLGGRHPSDLRVPDGDPLLAGLYDPFGVPGGSGVDPELARILADPAVTRALGVRSSLADLLAEPGGADELLTRLADPARPVSRPQLRSLWSALATADGVTPENITPPDRVRAIAGDKLTVADAADALILDAPDLWPLAADQPLVLVPHAYATRLADLLDLPLASEEIPGVIESAGELRPVPGVVREVLADALAAYREHDSLVVDGTDVPWRYQDGALHASTVEGLAHGLAWAAGNWRARHLLAALLVSPEETARLLVETDLDD
jgi:hypothetical protein